MYWDDEFALEEYDDLNWSIWSQLQETVALWKDTYREYWGLDSNERPERLSEEQAARARMEHRLAVALMKMIPVLSLSGAADPEKTIAPTAAQIKELRQALRDQKEYHAVADWVALALADDFLRQVDGASKRAFRLVGLVQGRRFSERATSYFRRVTTLYLQGLELEAGVMCRAALEAALQERLEEEIPADGEPPSLDEMLRIAGEKELLPTLEPSPRSRRKWRPVTGSPLHQADRIRFAGNFIMHEFACYPNEDGQIRDAFEAIRALTVVLAALFPPPKLS